MEQLLTKEVIDFCDKLVENGDELKITWSGGNDEGFFELMLNGEHLSVSDENVHVLLRLATKTLNYGGFDGDFNTFGEAIYDPDRKCFVGEDDYSSTDEGLQECKIKIKLPESLFFDSLAIDFNADGNWQFDNAFVRCIISNGPRLKACNDIEDEIANYLASEIRQATQNIPYLEAVWVNVIIERKQFLLEDDNLVFTIENIPYSYYKDVVSPVIISLTH